MKNLLSFMREYAVSLLSLIKHVGKIGKQSIRVMQKKLPIWEFVFLASAVGLFLLLSFGWLAYEIQFSESLALSENIITNDFFWIFWLLVLAVLPVFFMLFSAKKEKFKPVAFVMRMGALGIILILYVANLIWRQRIAATPEAHFTVAFFLFAVFLIAAGATGFFSLQDFFLATEKNPLANWLEDISKKYIDVVFRGTRTKKIFAPPEQKNQNIDTDTQNKKNLLEHPRQHAEVQKLVKTKTADETRKKAKSQKNNNSAKSMRKTKRNSPKVLKNTSAKQEPKKEVEVIKIVKKKATR